MSNEPMQGHTDPDTCEKYPTEPHLFVYQCGLHLPSVGVCSCCGAADRKDVARQIAEAAQQKDEALQELVLYFWEQASEPLAGLEESNAYRDARDKLAAILDGES